MVMDPYKVLGVTPEASGDDIKKAYRSLSRRYHPDANINNPNKAQAEEKFKEIQVAYDRIMKDRENGNFSGYSQGSYGQGTYGQGAYRQGGYGQGNYNQGAYGNSTGQNAYGPFGYGSYGTGDGTFQGQEESPRLRAAAVYINSRNFMEAMTVLESIQDRNAVWYYYSALANQGLGNNVTALEAARQAAALEPGNMQYQILLKRMEGGGIWYENMGEGYGRAGEGLGRVCTTLCWLTMLCNCCFMRPY